jgi:hypothetical protein
LFKRILKASAQTATAGTRRVRQPASAYLANVLQLVGDKAAVKVGRHRLRLRPPRKAEWRQWGLYRPSARLGPSGHSLAGNLHEGRSRDAGSRTMSAISPPRSRRWSVAAVVASREGTITAAMLEPGAIALHTCQMIKILRAAQELSLNTSGEIIVRHQFSNLPAK